MPTAPEPSESDGDYAAVYGWQDRVLRAGGERRACYDGGPGMRTAQTSGLLLSLVLATSLGARADAPMLGLPGPAYEAFQGGVRGTVTSQQMGQPVTDAAVLIEGERPDQQDLKTTDRKGEYCSGPLREGTYRLRFIRGQTISERTVQIQKQKTLTLHVVLPPEPPRPVDKGQPADYVSWLPCKIVNTVPDPNGMILMIDLGSKQHVGPSMEGVVLKGDVPQPIEGGGRFKIFNVLNGTLSLGLLSSYWPQVKNHACRINARSF